MHTGRSLITIWLLICSFTILPSILAEDSFAKWEEPISAFEQADKENPPPAHPVLFVGSSSIRLWDLDKSFPNLKTLNRGFGGSTIADSIHFFDRIIRPYQPKIIILYAGDNDIKKELSPREVFENFKTLANKIETSLPGTHLIYIAIKPSISRKKLWPEMKQANDLIAAWCAQRSILSFADIAKPMLDNPGHEPNPDLFKKDGLHLNEKGYELWRKVLSPLIQQTK